MSKLGLYFHTLRHLRPIQVAGRVWLRLRRPAPDPSPAPPPRKMAGTFIPPITPAPSLVVPHVFRLLNVERTCASAADWLPQGAPKLWVYNLHYFDDLNARDAQSRLAWHQALFTRWVAQNPPALGDGWEPYPVSRRIVNWIKWTVRGNALSADVHHSLAVQARWLAVRLEYHILGNHLFANAKALIFAGLYFDGNEAQHWYKRGVALAERQLKEQVLADGGHFELSPMYHAAFLEDVLDLINILRAHRHEPPRAWLECGTRMQRWLRTMSHPDGDISFFNDAAFGIVPTLAELRDYSIRLGLAALPDDVAPMLALTPSGYVCVADGNAYLLCDCASVGPDYLPGHAHADTLSFEFSVSGQRIFVNSGTSEYGVGPERQRQRGTAAHNTVVVNGENSSQVWAGFRVAKRARAYIHQAAMSGKDAVVEATHDGYRRLPGRIEHGRRWTMNEHSLQIEDRLSGGFAKAQAWFHLHPGVTAEARDGREIELTWRGGSGRIVFDGAAFVELMAGTWHPRFGVAVENRCIVVGFAGATLKTRMQWTES